MKTPTYSAEQILKVLEQADKGDQTVGALCREHAIAEATFYRWRKFIRIIWRYAARSESHGVLPWDSERLPITSSNSKESAPWKATLDTLPPKPLPASRRLHVSVAV